MFYEHNDSELQRILEQTLVPMDNWPPRCVEASGSKPLGEADASSDNEEVWAPVEHLVQHRLFYNVQCTIDTRGPVAEQCVVFRALSDEQFVV